MTGVDLMASDERERIASLLRRFSAESPPFSGAAWLLPWLSLYGRAGDESRVACIDADTGAMLVPMMVRPVRRKKIRWRELRFLGTGDNGDDEIVTEYPDISLKGMTDARAIEALVGWLHGSGDWDLLAVEAVEPGSVLARALACAGGFSRHGGYRYRLTLPEQLDLWLETRSVNARARFRRTLRQVSQRGLRFEPCLPADKGLEVLARLHQRQWNQRGKPGAFASQRFLQFHQQLLDSGSLNARIAGLFRDDTPLSLWYGFDIDRTRYYYQSGMDEVAAEGLPAGEALHLLMIADAIASGFSAYDFMRGADQSWKARYVSDRSELQNWILPGHSLRGHLLALWLNGHRHWHRRSPL